MDSDELRLLTEERWGRWQRGIAAGEPVAVDALWRLVAYMGRVRASEELSAREVEVLQGMADGGTMTQVADKLGIGRETAKSHSRSIRFKLNASTGNHAVAIGFREGLIR